MAASSASSSSPASAPAGQARVDRDRALACSLAALLLERSLLDKALLATEPNPSPALRTIAHKAAEWIEWSAWDECIASMQAERHAALEAERLVESDERAAAEAEAIADGHPPPVHPKPDADHAEKSSAIDSAAFPVPFSLAQPLVESPELSARLVSFLLHECLVRPHPVTRVNTALLRDPASRKTAFALLQVACQHHEEALRAVIAWIGQTYGRTRAEQLQLLGVEATSEDEWGIDPSQSQRSASGYVGLKNQAATCYQNSFLQLMFHTDGFSEALLNVRERSASEEASAADSANADEELSLLSRVQSIFFYLSHSRRRFFDPLAFVRSFKGWDGQPLPPNQQQDVYEFCCMLFDRLETNLDSVMKKLGTNAAGGKSSAASAAVNLLKDRFGGQLQNEMICSEYPVQSDHKFVRLEPFMVLSLVIKGCKSLEDALRLFVEGELLEGANAYMCSLCKQKRDTKKRCVVAQWPRTAIFHLKRFEFDMEKLKTVKLNDELTFPLEIDLRPYTSEGMQEREAQEAAEAARQQREAAGGGDGDEHKDHHADEDGREHEDHLSHTLIALDPMIFYSCASCARKAEVHCHECAKDLCSEHEQQAHANLSPPLHNAEDAEEPAVAQQPEIKPTLMYRLVGVLVHSGHAEGGHYYSFIRTPVKAPASSSSSSSSSAAAAAEAPLFRWHQFNDMDISDFDPAHLPLEAFGGMEDPEGIPGGSTGGTADGSDPSLTSGGFETVNHKGRKRGKKGKQHAPDEEWQTGKLEKSRNAYLLWYERIEDDEERKVADGDDASIASTASPAASVESLASSVDSLSLSASSPSSSAASSLSAFHSLDVSSLPAPLRAMHTRIVRENAQQLQDELLFEKACHDAIYRIARDNIDWLPARKPKSTTAAGDSSQGSSASSSIARAPAYNGSRYLQDVDGELDASDLSVQFVQNLTLFVLESVVRSAESTRLDQWCVLLQHAYAEHVGCCQWLLERFVLDPPKLTAIMMQCPAEATRKSLANLLELAAKKLIRFELDDSFVDALHITVPPLKPVQKREDAQAGLAAALGSDQAASAAAASVAAVSSAAEPSKSTVSQSSSSASFLSSALVQSASVESQLLPAGVLKGSAKATVSVSAKLSVLDGVGAGTEKQLSRVGIKTLQQLVEITPKQRELIATAPAPSMTSALLQTLHERAQQAVDCILELSGVNEKLAAEKAHAAEQAAIIRAQRGSEFVGPRLLPAFIRTCLQTLGRIESSISGDMHCCAELCALLANLASCNPAMLQLILDSKAVQACIDVVTLPVKYDDNDDDDGEDDGETPAEEQEAAASESAQVEESKADEPADPAASPKSPAELREEAELAEALAAIAAAEASEAKQLLAEKKKAERKQRKKERNNKNPPPGSAADVTDSSAAAAVAAASNDDAVPAASPSLEPTASVSSVASTVSSSASAGEEKSHNGLSQDEYNALRDMSVVDVVHLIDVLVRASTTRAGKINEAVQPLPAPGPSLPEEAWHALQQPAFVSRLVMQISSTKPDPPCSLAAHCAWENMSFTDTLVDRAFVAIRREDFFDFYACIKLLQHLLMHVHDSLHEYRVHLIMPKLLQAASEQRQYYKAAELLIKSMMHLIQHVPACAAWAKGQQDELRWIDAWLGKNKRMPELPVPKGQTLPEGACTAVVKFGSTAGVNAKWEKDWINQIAEYGVLTCESDSVSDYQKIFRKLMLNVKTRK